MSGYIISTGKGEQVPFQPLFKNIGEKLAFQKVDFSAIFSPIFKETDSVLKS
jgi:hypothetical protein